MITESWSVDERYAIPETLRQYESQCDAVAGARQETMQTHRVTMARIDGRALNKYLYQSLSVSYPVLTDLATLGELLREARQRLERALL